MSSSQWLLMMSLWLSLFVVIFVSCGCRCDCGLWLSLCHQCSLVVIVGCSGVVVVAFWLYQHHEQSGEQDQAPPDVLFLFTSP